MHDLPDQIRACRLCADRFAATATRHAPRPIVWFKPGARILIASQAPGWQAHEKRKPFEDRSGDRLRDWMGLDHSAFYDTDRIAIIPMAFCFPGYDAKGADLPPPKICAATWHDRVYDWMPDMRLKLVIGAYSQRYHLGTKGPLTNTVAGFRDHLPDTIPLPHPSWRNTAWLKRNPWFETDLLPVLRAKVKEALL